VTARLPITTKGSIL